MASSQCARLCASVRESPGQTSSRRRIPDGGGESGEEAAAEAAAVATTQTTHAGENHTIAGATG